MDFAPSLPLPGAPAYARLSALWSAFAARVATRWPELGVVLAGMALRLCMLKTYPVSQGYDFSEHQAAVEHWRHHVSMPDLLLSRGAYHPQLYYFLCGLIRRAGGSWRAVQALSVLLGCLRLGLVWIAAERYLPVRRGARLAMLALAAVLPASVHLDGMATQESLNNVLAVAFVIALLELARASAERRARRAVVLGLCTGFGLLVKVSNFALLGLLAIAPLFELHLRADLAPALRVKRLGAWALAIGVAVVVASPQYVYNQRTYGKMVIDGWYKRPTADTTKVGAHRMEVLDRRTLGYFVGFTADIVRFPFAPSGVSPTPRFWPVLIASSFCDYQGYHFAPERDVGAPMVAQGTFVGRRAFHLARASVACGIVIALVTAAAWLVAAVRLWRRREVARTLVLLVPALGVLGQMYFATRYPYDFEGVVKGIYFHFVTLPLYALFGLGVAWVWRRARPLGLLSASLILPVALYTIACVWH
jgi:hypothetical protein